MDLRAFSGQLGRWLTTPLMGNTGTTGATATKRIFGLVSLELVSIRNSRYSLTALPN